MSGDPIQPSGKLILVSTPIGNLGDMTYRAVDALREASVILAEDTRHTRRLLNHYAINNHMLSYHDHNKERVTPGIVERLRGGDVIALVSDAGTPCISDPGFYLTRAAIDAGIEVTTMPGASAVLPALLMSGFPTDAFVFEGFLPRKRGELTRRLSAFSEETRTVVLYASPHRLVKVLEVLAEVMPDRQVAVVREITKIHEEARRGTASELLEHYAPRKVKGEIVVVIKGRGKA